MPTQSFPVPAATDPSGLVVMTHLVDRTDALRARFSGAVEPSSPVALQPWADTTTGMMRIRNAANSAWVDVHPIAFIPMQSYPLQAAGALGAMELQLVAPHDLTIARAVLLPDTTTTSSSLGVTDWQFMLRNVTQSVDLFSSTPGTNGTVATVGGGELAADTPYPLLADQNQSVAAGDVLRFTVTVNGSPTAVADMAVQLDYLPRGA